VNLHLDPNEFAPVIEAAVEAAIRRFQAERQADGAGKLLLDKKAAAESMAISVSSLDRLIRDGELRAVKLSGRVLVSPDAIRDFIRIKEAEEVKP